LASPNLAEMFSNRGFAPNCMVMFAVEINGVFPDLKLVNAIAQKCAKRGAL